MIRILFFGPVAEKIEKREMQIDHSPGLSLQDVVTQLKSQYPQVFDIISFIAVNNVQTREMELMLQDNDEIAFMAKFSGG